MKTFFSFSRLNLDDFPIFSRRPSSTKSRRISMLEHNLSNACLGIYDWKNQKISMKTPLSLHPPSGNHFKKGKERRRKGKSDRRILHGLGCTLPCRRRRKGRSGCRPLKRMCQRSRGRGWFRGKRNEKAWQIHILFRCLTLFLTSLRKRSPLRRMLLLMAPSAICWPRYLRVCSLEPVAYHGPGFSWRLLSLSIPRLVIVFQEGKGDGIRWSFMHIYGLLGSRTSTENTIKSARWVVFLFFFHWHSPFFKLAVWFCFVVICDEFPLSSKFVETKIAYCMYAYLACRREKVSTQIEKEKNLRKFHSMSSLWLQKGLFFFFRERMTIKFNIHRAQSLLRTWMW